MEFILILLTNNPSQLQYKVFVQQYSFASTRFGQKIL